MFDHAYYARIDKKLEWKEQKAANKRDDDDGGGGDGGKVEKLKSGGEHSQEMHKRKGLLNDEYPQTKEVLVENNNNDSVEPYQDFEQNLKLYSDP